mmetsp:Transcript_156436/g.499467  ORF Transcript_156436/g.499467 Transcript_156436/m.499467 type:complete len:89 (-) Transcript_156436:27-293(-)
METVVLIDSPLPLWAQQVDLVTQKKGAFHKPIKGILKIATGHAGSSTSTMYYLIVVVACVLLVGLVVKCGRARKQPSARDLEACSDDK